MNNYRVDRAQESVSPPCGMNSICYIGDSLDDAVKVFHATVGGKDAWNSENCTYGVMLSIWNSARRDWIVKRWKN